jgi:hypothetical protein
VVSGVEWNDAGNLLLWITKRHNATTTFLSPLYFFHPTHILHSIRTVRLFTLHDTRCPTPFYSTRITTSQKVTPLCFYFIFNCQPILSRILICIHMCISLSQHSSVGIATRYGLDGPGSNSGVCEIFRTSADRV